MTQHYHMLCDAGWRIQKGLGRTLGILVYNSLLYTPETDLVTEPGARLAASKSH